MTWVRFDDSFYDHPKIVAAGPAAGFLFVRSVGYAARQLTDGAISKEVLQMLAGRGGTRLANRLVAVGLWETTDAGYQIHDYLEYQPCAQSVHEKRTQLSATRAAAGRLGGRPRAYKPLILEQTESNAKANGKQNESPVPGPGPGPDPGDASTPDVSEPGCFGPPARKTRATTVDEGFIQDMVARHGERLGGEEAIRDNISLCLDHARRKHYTDLRAAVRNWLRGARPLQGGRYGTAGVDDHGGRRGFGGDGRSGGFSRAFGQRYDPSDPLIAADIAKFDRIRALVDAQSVGGGADAASPAHGGGGGSGRTGETGVGGAAAAGAAVGEGVSGGAAPRLQAVVGTPALRVSAGSDPGDAAGGVLVSGLRGVEPDDQRGGESAVLWLWGRAGGSGATPRSAGASAGSTARGVTGEHADPAAVAAVHVRHLSGPRESDAAPGAAVGSGDQRGPGDEPDGVGFALDREERAGVLCADGADGGDALSWEVLRRRLLASGGAGGERAGGGLDGARRDWADRTSDPLGVRRSGETAGYGLRGRGVVSGGERASPRGPGDDFHGERVAGGDSGAAGAVVHGSSHGDVRQGVLGAAHGGGEPAQWGFSQWRAVSKW